MERSAIIITQSTTKFSQRLTEKFPTNAKHHNRYPSLFAREGIRRTEGFFKKTLIC